MKRLIKSEHKTDESTFRPCLNIIFYDDLDFQLHKIKVNLSAEFTQELNAMRDVNLEQSNELLEFFLTSKGGSSTLISDDIVDVSDINIDDIEKGYKINKRYTYVDYYDDLLNNIKLLRREKNLHDLGL